MSFVEVETITSIVNNVADDNQTFISELTPPVKYSMDELTEILESSAKISAQYDKFTGLVDKIQSLMVGRADISQLMYSFSGKVSSQTGTSLNSVGEVNENEEEEEEVTPKKVFTRDELIDGLQQNTFRRVAFMTGAGISVAAGIPDFRTPNSGLYAKMEQLGLPYPEAIFSIEYLRERPEAFYQMANGFLNFKAHPTNTHQFIKHCADRDVLQMCYTQNIDGLELDAGLSLDLLVQAHGHMRTAHCIDCSFSHDITTFFAHVEKSEVLYCTACHGIVKPDIVFFGETLPEKFSEEFSRINTCDLIFVMGTSLKVYPFASLLNSLPVTTPVVLFNNENPGICRDSLLFIPGDIESNVTQLMTDLGRGWECCRVVC